MSLTAEFRLGSDQLPLVDVAAALPDLTLQLENGDQPESGPFVFVIRAAGASFDRDCCDCLPVAPTPCRRHTEMTHNNPYDGLETALDHSPWVQEHVLISDTGTMRIYQLVTPNRRPTSVEKFWLGKTHLESVTFLPDGWRMRQQFADRDAFATFRDSCSEMNISFHLDRLYDSTSTNVDLIGVTDKQREALLTAYEMGYFAVPRETSMATVAAALDISLPALAERLHRAEEHLIEHFFYSTLYSTPDSLGSN